jgi:elongation factor Ts
VQSKEECLKVSTESIKELREKSGAGVMECRNALAQAEGHLEKALELLKQQSLVKVEKKKTRTAAQGLIDSYVHAGGRIAAMVELNCETDFVARTAEFKTLAHDIAMQVAAMSPVCVSAEDVPADCNLPATSAALLLQPFIRDQAITIMDLINQTIAKTGENIKISRFARYEVGD